MSTATLPCKDSVWSTGLGWAGLLDVDASDFVTGLLPAGFLAASAIELGNLRLKGEGGGDQFSSNQQTHPVFFAKYIEFSF